MKNLGKVFFFFLLLIVSGQMYAQKIGIQGGINLVNMLDKDDEGTYSDEYDMNLGFNAGATVDLELSKLMSLEVGAIVDSKGFKVSQEGYSLKLKFLYLDVPVLLKAGYSLSSVRLFGAAGPYIGVGLTGKVVAEMDGQKESEDIKWGSGEDNDIKRLDYGAKFGIGAEVMKFSLGAYYSLGLANVAAVTDGGTKGKHKVISISLGYRF